MASSVVAGLIGGVLGGGLGILGAAMSSHLGPRKLEEWRAERMDKPRMRMLKELLEDDRFQDGRLLKTLQTYTRTTEEECRRLLIQLEARGIDVKEGEGWVLIERKPFVSQ